MQINETFQSFEMLRWETDDDHKLASVTHSSEMVSTKDGVLGHRT